MRKFKSIFTVLCLTSFLLTSAGVFAKEKTSSGCPPEGCPVPDETSKPEDPEYQSQQQEYKRLIYTFGMAGSYFVRKGGIDTKGNVGAYTGINYRFSRAFSAGFSTYYGWLIGAGNQYWSSFNPELKFFPMMYKNPSFEPFIFIGGHAMEAIFGDSDMGKMGMGQGGFAGVGFAMHPESWILGLQFFARASFLSMQRPKTIGGRGFAIPVFGFIGVSY